MTTPTPPHILAMARAIWLEMKKRGLVGGALKSSRANNLPSWTCALRCALAAEKARPVGEVPEGWRWVHGELYRLSLLIESAVREVDPNNHDLVLRLIKANKAVSDSAPLLPERSGGGSEEDEALLAEANELAARQEASRYSSEHTRAVVKCLRALASRLRSKTEDPELTALGELSEKATKGPWFRQMGGAYPSDIASAAASAPLALGCDDVDADLIVGAVNYVRSRLSRSKEKG